MSGGAGLALVVDDEWLVLETLVGYRELLGLTPVPANGGEEALRLLDAHPGIGVLISDVRMPGIDGLELARRAAARRPDLKIVLTTGYAQVDGVPWPVLPKPYFVQDLGRALRAIGVPAAADVSGGGAGTRAS